MPESGNPLIRALPVVLFAVFALFWTGYDIALGLWWATLPTVAVSVALVVHAVLGRAR